MKKVAVSVHATNDFSPEILRNLKGLDFIHVDVMDGKFVKPINLNLNVFKVINQNFKIPIIAHMMVIDPFNYVDKIIDYIYAFFFHYESKGEKYQIINKVHQYKKKVGLVINPSTPVDKITEFLAKIDYILILGVNPGYSGQKFILSTIEKLNELAKLKVQYGFQIDIDGGITLENLKELHQADIISSFSTIFHSKNPNRMIKKIQKI
jgi:ribulose-phosphate 3-epimerase